MSLVATRLQNWRIENPELDRNMTRPCEYGALDFFIEQTNAPSSIINPNLRDRAFASIGNTVQVPVINYDGDVQVSNVRSCVIADDENTSALVTVVWATYAIGFTMVPAAYMNNEISYEHDFLRKMEKTCRALADKLDVGAVAATKQRCSKRCLTTRRRATWYRFQPKWRPRFWAILTRLCGLTVTRNISTLSPTPGLIALSVNLRNMAFTTT